MSPTRNGHHNPQHHSTASSSSSTGTIPKVAPPQQQQPQQQQQGQPAGGGGGGSGGRMMQPGFSMVTSAEFSSPGGGGAAAAANSTQDLSQLGLNDLSFAEITEQNLLLRRLRDQQERLRQLQQHQVEMLHWQESETAARQMDGDLTGRRAAAIAATAAAEAAAAAAAGSSSSSRSMDQLDLRSSFLEGMLGRMEQLPNPQQISDNLEQLQQRISFLRLLDAEANIVQAESHQQANGDLEAQKLDLMKKLAHLESKKLRMDKSLRQSGGGGDQHHHQQQLQQQQQRSRSCNSSKSEEMWLLKERLRDLQHMVEAMEEGPTSPAPSSTYEKPKTTQQINATDHLLAEMQEQLKLQKELHLRRKELEDLMRKDLLESMRKNDQGQNIPGWYAEAALVGLPANHYQARSRQMSDSSSSRSNLGLPLPTTPASSTAATDKQLRDLQALMDNMQCEIRRLNASGNNHYCQRQFQELSHSVNQCLQAMLCLQRDVSCLHREVEKLMRQQRGQGEDSGLSSSVSRPSETLEDGGGVFNPWPVVPDMSNSMTGVFEAADAWLQNVPGSDAGGSGGGGGGDAWGIGANSLSHHLNETSSVVALNNQVLPGMRANNYWDNFRSFSRQNRLSNVSSSSSHFHPLSSSVFVASPSVVAVTATAAAAHAAAAAAPNVAQVTPRQLQSTPNSVIMEQPAHSRARQASVEPNFVSMNSPPRPRRKQKINREQNREVFSENSQSQSSSSNRGIGGLSRSDQPGHYATAAMVFPMPQNQDRNVNRDTSSTSPPPPPFNLATVNPVVGSLTRSIYNQVNNLISQHEERPDQLERIFHNLQSLDNRLIGRFDSSVIRGQRQFLATEESPIQDQNYELSNNAPKLRTDKRFSYPRAEGGAAGSSTFFAASAAAAAAAGGSGGDPGTGQRQAAAVAEQFPSTIHNSLNRQEQFENQSDGATVAAAADRNNVGGAEGNSGAVPKNVQWNLKSSSQHADDGSKVPLYLREMPKNMQEQQPFDHCLPETDMLNNVSFFNNEQDFINIDIGFGSAFREDDNRPSQALDGRRGEPQDQEDAEDEEEEDDEEEEESEIPEADQGHSPEHALQAHFLGAAGRHHSREESEEVTAAAAATAVAATTTATATQGGNEPVDAEGSNDYEEDNGTEDRGARTSVASAALLEHQMMEEEASMRSLVDEVLDDSSDSSVAADDVVQKPS